MLGEAGFKPGSLALTFAWPTKCATASMGEPGGSANSGFPLSRSALGFIRQFIHHNRNGRPMRPRETSYSSAGLWPRVIWLR